jgi:hypothetical protein
MSKPERFLSRWSRRKLEALRTPAEAPAVPAPPPPAGAAVAPAAATAELPPVESLTFDSDFAAFLKPGVDETVRRAALRKLLHDPRFNVMDGLDVYIDDYTKFEPLDASIVRELVSARYIFSPPATRVNAEGVVEDVPTEEALPDAVAEAPAALESQQAERPGEPDHQARKDT